MKRLAEQFLGQAQRQIAEQARTGGAKKIALLRSRLMPQQARFIDDPARRKALLCPRRAGKTHAIAVYLVETCLRRRRADCLYVSITLKKAKELIWDTLKRLNEDFELGCEFWEVDAVCRFPDGSKITLKGCDTWRDIEKFRGGGHHVVVLDETGSFEPLLLGKLLQDGIGPTLGDHQGTLVLAGTPGMILAGQFYEATTMAPGWSRHGWPIQDNTALPHLWGEALAEKARNGWTDANPKWRREYLGEWVADVSELVYPYHPDRNTWTPGRATPGNPFGLPEQFAPWFYVAAMDIGFDAEFALEVAAYSYTCPNFFQVYEDGGSGLTVTPIIGKIRDAERACPGGFAKIVGDRGGGGKGFFETLVSEHGIPIEAADKAQRRAHQDLLAGDLVDGRCKLLPGSRLAQQMSRLTWSDATRKVEAEMPRDYCDAFLYLRTASRHHYAQQPQNEPKPGTPEWFAAREQEEIERIVQSHRRAEEGFGDAADWDPEGFE